MISLDRPAWEPPKIRAVETLLEEHKILTQGLCSNTIATANVEPAVRNIIVLAQAIDKRVGNVMDGFETEFVAQKKKLENTKADIDYINNTAYNRALIEIEGKAMTAISKFIQGEGTEMRIWIVREKQYDKDGKPFYFAETEDQADKLVEKLDGDRVDGE